MFGFDDDDGGSKEKVCSCRLTLSAHRSLAFVALQLKSADYQAAARVTMQARAKSRSKKNAFQFSRDDDD